MSDTNNYLGFSMEKKGDVTIFASKGAGAGFGYWFWMLIFSVICGVIAWGALGHPIGLFLGFGGFFLFTVMIDACRREEYSFSISEDNITVDGSVYAKERLTEVIIGNKSGESHSSSVVISTSVSYQAGSTIGDSIRSSLIKRNYYVAVRYGRNVIYLSKGMTEDVAISMYHEVMRVLTE